MAMEAAVIGLFAVMLFMKQSLAPFLPFPHSVWLVYCSFPEQHHLDDCPQKTELKMRDLTEKQFVAAMERNGFMKDQSLLNGFRHPDLPKPMFMTVLIQANGHRGALKAALESLKKAQASRAKADQEQ